MSNRKRNCKIKPKHVIITAKNNVKNIMRIISGLYQGFVLKTPKNSSYRPSMGKVKEAVFSWLNSRDLLKNAKALDLFCGSASYAFEALSRGAFFALAIDIDRNALDYAREFAEKYNIPNIEFINGDATKLRNSRHQFDVVFIDPPYNQGLVEKSLKILSERNWLQQEATVIIETERTEDIPLVENYTQLDSRTYGSSKITMLQYEKK
ncbi:MAG: 16S rRNA (guanine(966)-N(2))-methyltransferase RsmD [Rickettsiaceae bacterium]|nr:16S rRNA (guanine(966)-N(2))-methyltransferase RsmD [Rickettsiaceae bacterium]